MISMLDEKLNEWGSTQPWTLTKGVRDSKGVLTYAVILWPDSTSDEYFADEQDPTTGAVNGLSSFGRIGNVTAGLTSSVNKFGFTGGL
ncbi:hypothetical protein BCO9919_03145 [Burkholderia cenocepacia]|uniref:Uncharacterized protein n=1 Tax=Burkholderia cenocepacia TaxID=95486 RepID=A0A6J5J910_9BURK|nr:MULTISPECIES: hypothetical protein [Burkholderia cepacia complex]CAB3968166.1 hypothetical protein BCO9919_03145 [Burkholderia cenocepacia]